LRSHAESVLHAFRGGQDGAIPYAGLLVVNGNLYGSTLSGGSACDCGTVFVVNPSSGQEKVVHRFSEDENGYSPFTNLVALDGKIYGSTSNGGSKRHCEYGCGTIFEFDPASQKLRVIHRFNNDDGADWAYLAAFNGKLYGTTVTGGDPGCDYSRCGTLFELNPSSGIETVLHRFRGGTDGAYPAAAPVIENGMIYGTTGQGGSTHCSGFGCGTLYTFDVASKQQTILHRFTGGMGGQGPESTVTVGDEMYGTTGVGGAPGCSNCGTIFSYTPKTKRFETVYHLSTKDGANPQSGPLALEGKLYGTASSGGVGFGTVFEYEP
jgi:uncharacterized repeat protein (TIGR03803 family)